MLAVEKTNNAESYKEQLYYEEQFSSTGRKLNPEETSRV